MAKAMGIGVDAVTEWFTTNADSNAPYYSVWQGKNIVFTSKEEDFEKALQLLEDNLKACEQNSYDEILILKLHYITKGNKHQIITDKTPVVASYSFRVVPLQSGGYMQPYNADQRPAPYGGYGSQIIEKLNGIESRLNAIESDDDDDFEDASTGAIEQPNNDGFYGLLNNLLQQPEVKQLAVNILSGIVQKIIPMNTTQQHAQVAGIPDYNNMTVEQKLTTAINIIAQQRPQIIDDIVHLANIAQTDPNKFNFIMQMLPK